MRCPTARRPTEKAELWVFGPVSCCSGAGVADNARLSPTNAITQHVALIAVLLGLSIALCSSATFADTVWLKNGDRLSGTIRFFDGSKLLLETDYGGSIPLSWKKIATLQSDHELLVKLARWMASVPNRCWRLSRARSRWSMATRRKPSSWRRSSRS